MEENGEGEVRIKFGEERKVGSIWELRVGEDINLSYPVGGGGLDVVEYRIGRAPEKVELPDDGVERTVVNLKLVGE
ncbi:hypothetical protein KKG65_00885, partial [Patescibacteria group bacterium]|nr:hypothetical protein [Patescibacteria group bacterium]